MSIQSEIDRIAGAKPILGNYLQQNGVAVPSGATLDEMALQLADVIEKQNKITVSGILKGDGAGGVSAAVAGTDYQPPLIAGLDYASQEQVDYIQEQIDSINFAFQGKANRPVPRTDLPTSGTALTNNSVYTVSAAVDTYTFEPPSDGWAHGTFTTGTAPNITFTGKIIGKLPTFEASKQYEFDVYNGAWIVQEVVTQ